MIYLDFNDDSTIHLIFNIFNAVSRCGNSSLPFVTNAQPRPTWVGRPRRGAGHGQIACHQLHRFVASMQNAAHQWVIMV